MKLKYQTVMRVDFMQNFLLSCAILTLLSCSKASRDIEDSDFGRDKVSRQESVLVKTSKASVKKFIYQINTNGKLLTSQEVVLSFSKPGNLQSILVKSGSIVKKGQIIAVLQNDTERLLLQDAQLSVEESKIEINDLLISQGGKSGDSTSVSAGVYRYIKLRSGFERAVLNEQKAKLELSRTLLHAPFDAVVANLTISKFGSVNSETPICTLVSKDIQVRCPVLETELAIVGKEQLAHIKPVGQDDTYQGKVALINPVVSSQGLVDIYLDIFNPSTKLFSGMNVSVIIERPLFKELIVPKSAVTERNGRKVIFTYQNGIAIWHYVTVGLENEHEIIVKDGIKNGDEVILSGNANLAHEVKVTKVKEE